MAIPISNVTRRQVYAPSGTGGIGPYAFTFEILANTDIAVFKDDTLLTLTTHYTVTINVNGTGTVTITAAGLALPPTSPTQYAIVGNRTIARATDFTTGGDFFANTLNDELDQQTIFAQQNAEGVARALQAPQTDPTTIDMTLPRAADRANKTLAFDANGDPTLGISAADVANAVTYATNAANSATAAASSASTASTAATSAGNSATAAATSATSAASSATSASGSASTATTQASNASTSATAAAGSASTATTQATNAASSASAASTSASNAATSETNAATSASTASTQATNAATSATSAGTSATSAANSAAAAASALDSFDDRYLGTKTSDPALDNDGNALVAGALYFSTTENVMKVYDGASWITATSAGATSLLRFRYVATSGQTTFSGADSASATLTYTVNNIAVHRNGVTLDTSEYTASNGTSVVLNVAAGTGDIVDIIAFKSFTVADALSAVSGGTVGGSVAVTGNLSYTGTLTGGAGVVNLGSGQVYKDASGNVGIGTSSPVSTVGKSLHLYNDANTGTVASNAFLLVESSTRNSVVEVSGSATSTNSFGFSDTAGTALAGIASTVADQNLQFRAGSNTERMRIDSSGNLMVGTTSVGGVGHTFLTTGNYLSAMSGTGNNVHHEFKNGNGTVGYILTNGTSTSYVTSSDYRLKEAITPMTGALAKVAALKPCTYKWKVDGSGGQGFIAHELAEVEAGCVTGEKDAVDAEGNPKYQGIDTSFLVATLTAAIQEQQTLITALTARITALEGA